MNRAAWLVLLLALFLVLIGLLRLRFGLLLRYAEGALTLRLRLGWRSKTIYPKPKKAAGAAEETASSPKDEAQSKRLGAKQLRQSIGELYPLLLRALRCTGRRVRVSPCRLQIVFGGTEPDEVAKRYGQAEVLLWSVMPQLEQVLTIPDPDIQLGWDFEAEQTQAEGELGFSLRASDLLWLAIYAGLPLLWRLVRMRRENRKAPVSDT